jgi:hypothetical protein
MRRHGPWFDCTPEFSVDPAKGLFRAKIVTAPFDSCLYEAPRRIAPGKSNVETRRLVPKCRNDHNRIDRGCQQPLTSKTLPTPVYWPTRESGNINVDHGLGSWQLGEMR